MSAETNVEEKNQTKEEKAKEQPHVEQKVEQKKEEAKQEKGAGLSDKLKKIIKTVEELSVIELSQLVKALEEKFGVSAQAAVAVAAPGAAGTAGGVVEEQTEFEVVLTEAGAKKIQVIKEIRTITNLGLKEAKDLVEGAPKSVKQNISKDDAAKIKATLEAAGAKVEIK